MKNIGRLILVLIGIAVVLGFAALIIPNIELDNEVVTEDTQDTYQVSDFYAGELKEIVLENESGTLHLINENDSWYAAGYEDVSLDQDEITNMAYILTHIETDRIVSKDESEQYKYGIDNPAAKITTIHDYNTTQEYILGDKAPIIGEYYMALVGTGATFTVNTSVNAYATASIDDIKSLNSIDITIENLIKVSVDNKSINDNYTIQRISNDNDISLCYWEFIDNFNHDVDSRVLYLGSEGYDYDFLETLCSIAGKEIIGRQNEFFQDNDSSDYLLSAMLYSNENTPQTFTLYNYDEDNYALTFDGDDWVYSIPKVYITFMDIDKFMLSDPNLALISINSVDEVLINLPDVETKMQMSSYIKKNSDGTNMTDTYGNEVTGVDILMNETENLQVDDTLKQEQATWFYQDIVTIKIDGIINEPNISSLKEIGSIKYQFSSEYMSEYNITFYEYNLTHYLAKKNNDEVYFLINKHQLEYIAKRYEMLKLGQLDISY